MNQRKPAAGKAATTKHQSAPENPDRLNAKAAAELRSESRREQNNGPAPNTTTDEPASVADLQRACAWLEAGKTPAFRRMLQRTFNEIGQRLPFTARRVMEYFCASDAERAHIDAVNAARESLPPALMAAACDLAKVMGADNPGAFRTAMGRFIDAARASDSSPSPGRNALEVESDLRVPMPEKMRRELEATAEKAGWSPVDLARHCIAAGLDAAERDGVTAKARWGDDDDRNPVRMEAEQRVLSHVKQGLELMETHGAPDIAGAAAKIGRLLDKVVRAKSANRLKAPPPPCTVLSGLGAAAMIKAAHRAFQRALAAYRATS